MSEREVKMVSMNEVTPEIEAMTLRIQTLMAGSNYEKLLEVMKRHEEWQEWLNRLPESSRILSQNQIPLHEDRGILLRMICGGSFGIERERENIAINAQIRLLEARVEALKEEVSNKTNVAKGFVVTDVSPEAAQRLDAAQRDFRNDLYS